MRRRHYFAPIDSYIQSNPDPTVLMNQFHVAPQILLSPHSQDSWKTARRARFHFQIPAGIPLPRVFLLNVYVFQRRTSLAPLWSLPNLKDRHDVGLLLASTPRKQTRTTLEKDSFSQPSFRNYQRHHSKYRSFSASTAGDVLSK